MTIKCVIIIILLFKYDNNEEFVFNKWQIFNKYL